MSFVFTSFAFIINFMIYHDSKGQKNRQIQKYRKNDQKMTLLRYLDPLLALSKPVSESFSIVRIHCQLKKEPFLTPPRLMAFVIQMTTFSRSDTKILNP